jgi:hypothetical protein
MEKYVLSQRRKNTYDAGSKGRVDIDKIYEQNGFKIIYLSHLKFDKFHVYELLQGLLLPFRLKKACEIHVAIPFILSFPFHLYAILKLIRGRASKIVLLVYDLSYKRYENKINLRIWEVAVLRQADEIIAHTKAMADELKKQGIKSPMKILTLVDYLVQPNDIYREQDIHSILFAGNLQKSKFIQNLLCEKMWKLNTYFYGKNCPNLDKDNFQYMGVFHPDDVSHLKGAWGLVWDGDSISTCDSSMLGRYLKFNSPHKISLYLVAEKPVIVWNQSSLCDFVREKKIGITVNSLMEIPDRLSKVKESDYNEYIENVKEVAKKLRTGGFLSACINE